MFKNIRKWLIRLMYRRSMLKVKVLDRDTCTYYDRLEPFCVLTVDTAHGGFTFKFKEDRRKSWKKKESTFFRSYIVELQPPVNLVPVATDLGSKYVWALRIFFFKPNYSILTEALTDLYLDKMLEH